VLIADKANNRLLVVDRHGRIRWRFPRPGDLRRGQSFRGPDDAFFSPDGRYIIATEEDDDVISVIDVAHHRIVYRYGVPGRPGVGPNRLDSPDDALLLPDGYILTADIKNCRLLLIGPHSHRPTRTFGTTTNLCYHHPPRRYGSPNGAFPMNNGRYLVTEINGDWVDAIDLSGHVYWSTHPPGIAYPSDSNQIGRDRFLTVDYSTPGQVLIFNRAGRALWRYRPNGPQALDHPSLALPLPNGDILLNDDYNNRVIVVDPHTRHIVWQYGYTGVPGAAPGYLDNPDGVDLVPPHSLLARHADTMGEPAPARQPTTRRHRGSR
jgi:DNA-binding beta-propeller fold protein YncE